MQINATKSGDHVQAALRGSLDISTVSDARDKLLETLNPLESIRFDLSDLTEIDTAGLQLLLAVRKEAESLGVECRFAHPSPAVEGVFRGFGRIGFFDEPVATASEKG